MADLSTLARPYAKAAFDYAKESNSVGEWQHYLELLSAMVRNREFQDYLYNPALKATAKVSALQDIYVNIQPQATQDNSVFANILTAIDNSQAASMPVSMNQLSPSFLNFLTQLSEQDRLALLPSICERFNHLIAMDSKQVYALVTSAYPLTNEQALLLENRLSESVGSQVVLQTQVDPSLMAGVTIKLGDKLIDDSVRGKLKQLKTQLTA